MNIETKLISKRTPVMEDQAVLMASLMTDLLAAASVAPDMDNHKLYSLPAYQRFIRGANACGFVCRDESVMPNFIEAMNQPTQFVTKACFQEIRHFLHSLLTNEKWAGGVSSPVLYCLKDGALEILAKRLESDSRLRMPTSMPTPTTSMAAGPKYEPDYDEMLQGTFEQETPQTQTTP